MSISSVTSDIWTSPYYGWSQDNSSSSTEASTSSESSTSSSATNTTPTSGVANIFQSLAADIQAVLIADQGSSSETGSTASTSGSTTSTSSGSTTTDPTQQLLTDLQTLATQIADNQSNQAGGTNSTQPSGMGPMPPPFGMDPSQSGGTGGQIGHHHHGEGAGSNASPPDMGSSGSQSSSSSGSSDPTQGVSDPNQGITAMLAQMVQAYTYNEGSTATNSAVTTV